MNRYDLVDIWREKFLNSRVYTWSNKSGSRKSRLDFWLIFKSLPVDRVIVQILPTPLSDHKAITINIDIFPNANLKGFSFWKMNNSLLSHNYVELELTKLIKLYWNKAQKEGAFGANWELLLKLVNI